MGNKKGISAVTAVLFSAGLCFFVVSILTVFRDGVVTVLDGKNKEKEAYCVMEFLGAENLGNQYGEQTALDGYSFYELTFSVTNEGTEDAYFVLPNLSVTGEEYDDVYSYWDTEEYSDGSETLFGGYEQYDAGLPVGRTGTAAEIVEVKDGVRKLSVSYYPNYSGADLSLEVSLD